MMMSLLTFGSIILIIWEMFLFRKTFISVLIPLSLLIFGGLVAFLLFRKRISFYVDNQHNIVLQAVHGTLLFGGLIMFSFMGANYYFAASKKQVYDLEVIETGHLTKRRRGCGKPFVVVRFNTTQKQLIFSCNTDVDGLKRVKVALNDGFLGYVVVKEVTPVI